MEEKLWLWRINGEQTVVKVGLLPRLGSVTTTPAEFLLKVAKRLLPLYFTTLCDVKGKVYLFIGYIFISLKKAQHHTTMVLNLQLF